MGGFGLGPVRHIANLRVTAISAANLAFALLNELVSLDPKMFQEPDGHELARLLMMFAKDVKFETDRWDIDISQIV